MRLKRSDRMLIISRRKDDQRQVFGRNVLQHGKTIHAGHLDIEKNQINLVLFDLFECFRTRRTFGDQFNVRFLTQEQTNPFARRGFIIHDNRLKLHQSACFAVVE